MSLRPGWFGTAALVLVAVTSPAMAADPLVLGPFVGTTPCADCPGIATELTLTRKDPYTAEGSYRLRMTYLERGPPLRVRPVTGPPCAAHRRTPMPLSTS